MRIRLVPKGEAVLQHIEHDTVTLVASLAFAPGAPIEGKTTAGQTLRFKVRNVHRIDNGFRIEAKLIDATRAIRALLKETLAEIRIFASDVKEICPKRPFT